MSIGRGAGAFQDVSGGDEMMCYPIEGGIVGRNVPDVPGGATGSSGCATSRREFAKPATLAVCGQPWRKVDLLGRWLAAVHLRDAMSPASSSSVMELVGISDGIGWQHGLE